MALPCPACKQPLGLNLQFIINNPVSVCPGCGIVLDFSVNEEVRNRFNEAMTEINKIKSRYKKIAKFG
jgi:transcription initiation factor IIE alpha subunit